MVQGRIREDKVEAVRPKCQGPDITRDERETWDLAMTPRLNGSGFDYINPHDMACSRSQVGQNAIFAKCLLEQIGFEHASRIGPPQPSADELEMDLAFLAGH